jgi:hypothetical protein
VGDNKVDALEPDGNYIWKEAAQIRVCKAKDENTDDWKFGNQFQVS